MNYKVLFCLPLLLSAPSAMAQTVLDNPAVTINLYEQRGGFISFAAEYHGVLRPGALVGKCRPDYVAETDLILRARIDDGAFQDFPLTVSCGAYPGRLGQNIFRAAPRGEHRVEIYFVDSRGNYDSDFGRNYRFTYSY